MNEPSWNELLAGEVERNGKYYYRTAARLLRGDVVAQDVCQQVFLQACNNQKQTDPSGLTLKAWLTRMVIIECLKVIRDGRIERRALGKYAATQPETVLGPWVQEELHEAALAALIRLPEPARSVVALRTLAGMSGNEVKQLLGYSSAKVSRQFHQGLEELRGLLLDDSRDTREPGRTAPNPE